MMGIVMIIGIATEMPIFLLAEHQPLETVVLPRQALCRAALDLVFREHKMVRFDIWRSGVQAERAIDDEGQSVGSGNEHRRGCARRKLQGILHAAC